MRATGAQVAQDVFFHLPDADRAARSLANGELAMAARHGGGAWQLLFEGKVVEALEAAQKGETTADIVLEAECLISVGAVVAGLELLQNLHGAEDANGTLLLARRCFLLGDYRMAEQVGSSLPLHAHAVLTVARAALLSNRPRVAIQALQPLLEGVEAIPDSSMAGSILLMAAACMVKLKSYQRLSRSARRILEHPELPEEMMPAAARIAWMGGLSATSWTRFGEKETPWAAAARLELALLSGDLELARKYRALAGAVGAPSVEALHLLEGKLIEGEGDRIFSQGYRVHIWRTHPTRWKPWIDTVLGSESDADIFDLAKGELPERDDLPKVIVDDGSLISMIAPQVVESKGAGRGRGLWIQEPLQELAGIGLDWPEEETEVLRQAAPMAKSPDAAAVVVASEKRALERANEGLPTVAIAPPGDPFWLGPIPESVWRPLRVARYDPKTGWKGAGEQVAALAKELENA